MGKIWIISDTHFGHEALTRNGWRPERWEEKLLKNWEKMVAEGDIVFHLGDFAIGKLDESKSITENIKLFRQRLKGRIILVRGNHDMKPNEWYMQNGFEVCVNKMIFNYKGVRLLLTHQPEIVDGDWDFNIHGHLHGNEHRGYFDNFPKLIDVSVDCLGWRPILLSDVFQLRVKANERGKYKED